MSLPDLRALVANAEPADLPSLVGELEAAKAAAWARLAGPSARPPDAPADRLLTMPQAAERLGITEHQARELGRRGDLPTVLVGERHVRVRASTLTEWIRRREKGCTLSRTGGR